MLKLLELPDVKIFNNPSAEELRGWARQEEKTTSFGAPAYLTKKVASRSAKDTQVCLEGPLGLNQPRLNPSTQDLVEKLVPRMLKTGEFIQIDRVLGNNPKKTWHCRLLIPKTYARIALMWSKTLFDPSPKQKEPRTKPDLLTVDFPNWPEAYNAIDGAGGLGPKGVFVFADSGVTYIFGTDYVGEVKMSFLRQAMFQMKRLGGLGLHAGSKIVKVKTGSGNLETQGVLLFGLSGTGKTTLTLDDHGLNSPEGVGVLQDDIVWLTEEGNAYGTENNFYVKTEGVTAESQPALFDSLMDADAVFENVAVSADGAPQFTNYAHGTNARALAKRTKIKNCHTGVNLERVNKIFFITRRDTVVPPVSKLSPEQAASYFMLGESIETSAGDPTKAGQPKHEVGFNPFIIGPEAEEGERMFEIVKKSKAECYLLNTGGIAKTSVRLPQGKKITKEISALLIREIARQSIAWQKDPYWGYLVPKSVPGINDWDANWNPRTFYDDQIYQKLCEELKKEREDFLAKFGSKLTL